MFITGAKVKAADGKAGTVEKRFNPGCVLVRWDDGSGISHVLDVDLTAI